MPARDLVILSLEQLVLVTGLSCSICLAFGLALTGLLALRTRKDRP